MARYSQKASRTVGKALHEQALGVLTSGRSGQPVKTRRQAIAIGISEARKAGMKVPPRSTRKKST